MSQLEKPQPSDFGAQIRNVLEQGIRHEAEEKARSEEYFRQPIVLPTEIIQNITQQSQKLPVLQQSQFMMRDPVGQQVTQLLTKGKLSILLPPKANSAGLNSANCLTNQLPL